MNLEHMSEHLQIFFTHNATTEARATRFVRRTSKMTGATFLQLVVFGWLDNARAPRSTIWRRLPMSIWPSRSRHRGCTPGSRR